MINLALIHPATAEADKIAFRGCLTAFFKNRDSLTNEELTH